MELTQDYLRSLFLYSEDGVLVWNKRKANFLNEGQVAGFINKKFKRRVIRIDGVNYLGARLIFCFHHGYFPEIVDHKDRDTTNDKIENLRAATAQENTTNRTSHKNSTSQYLGVCYTKSRNRWQAYISINRKVVRLGYFKTEAEAVVARNKASALHHGEFANINIIK